ncbi:MAG: hypothetical protein AVDCRST_MAG79-1193 [uncultured Thermoleophilia bacterium]|uniref:J domain-containing protein n=1 Tax=uncultured Thermoleophilia bacterium TaxID=1497501 RepID=A0A6J4TZ26_9ACTN|nr:MAG: hypothetical protein AVDCRST_MAG79-1193 [uncultured Thermoleophilia bacterium]
MAPSAAPGPRDCARALWLLGLTAPVTREEVTAAWRARVSRTHPDLHASSAAKSDAAAVLTRALNDARATLNRWIEDRRDWPDVRPRATTVRFDEADPEPWPERAPSAEPAVVDRRTGLRAGDRVRLWPYDGDVEQVQGTELDGPEGPTWVLFADRAAVRSERVRLAAYSCPVCGVCAGPAVDDPAVRPCPDCLVDLRRLDDRPAEAPRIRRAIEARAEAGVSIARELDDGRLIDRATERRRWARRLRDAGPEDLHAALLAAFGRAWERWGAPVG